MRALRIGSPAIEASAFKWFAGLVHLQIAVAKRDRFFPFDRFAYKRINEVPSIATGCVDEIFFPECEDRDEKQAETIAHEIDLIAPEVAAPAASDRLVIFELLTEWQYVKK